MPPIRSALCNRSLEAFQNLAHACFLMNQQRKQFLRAVRPSPSIAPNTGFTDHHLTATRHNPHHHHHNPSHTSTIHQKLPPTPAEPAPIHAAIGNRDAFSLWPEASHQMLAITTPPIPIPKAIFVAVSIVRRSLISR